MKGPVSGALRAQVHLSPVFFFFPLVFKDAKGRWGSAVCAGWERAGLGERRARSAPSEMTGSEPEEQGGTLPHYIFIVPAAEGPIKTA